ncbi:uncharacterized protein LOC129569118 [Sitodiplosis mosellana]|uniref:uncharacterized protein LOC129569118 n=1 Tax=Sitodiplosis mosellana TaxID=263140 RepID=UPI0024448D9F|nr:uncharacterized protein LOC129569118 [Sitodiplosis mosellana]
MLSTKRLGLFCSRTAFRGKYSSLSSRIIREFSSKNKNNHNKNHPKIEVTAKNDFVTHQLNSSIAAHLKRQQKLWNHAVEEEGQLRESRRIEYYFDEKTGKIEQTGYDGRSKMGKNQSQGYSKKYPNDGGDTRVNQKAYNAQKFDSDEDDLSENDSDDFNLDELEIPNWEAMNLATIKKHFYKPSTTTENRSTDEVREFRTNNHVTLSSTSLKPIFRFNELNDLPQSMIGEIERRYLLECTPIQSEGIPIALSGGNMIAISPSSTGKTLAMVLSAVIHISHQTPLNLEKGPIAVILALTQEIAEEIRQLADTFCHEAKIKCTVFKSNGPHKARNNTKPNDVGELLIATPCHLYELLRTKSLSLERCSQLSLYEADKMIEMCLEEEILQIESQIRHQCQRLIWSSSWTSELRKLTVNDYIRLDVGSAKVKEELSEKIKQIVKVSEEKKKKDELYEIINLIASQKGKQMTLIFTETPEKADQIANILRRKDYQCKSLHNQKSTSQRHEILSDFQYGKFPFLVLTDVAAKNVNFSEITDVVNFDMPLCISDYVHRVSRTGRSDHGTGTSYSIVSEEDGDLVDDLIGILQQSKQTIDPALFILKAANVDSDDEVAFAVPEGKGFKKYVIDHSKK